LNKVREYIKYNLKAKGRHGTHSPFVYDLVDKCFKMRIDDSFLKRRRELFRQLKHDHTIVKVVDLGAGSKYFNDQRKVSEIFTRSSSKGKFGDLLYQISNYYTPKRILEFGTSIGIGTINLACGFADSEVTTVEGCPNTAAQASKNIVQLGCENIIQKVMSFDQFIEQCPNKIFDIIFIDGHHDGNALIDYMNRLKVFSDENTLFILDDIRWSDSMFGAFNQIINDPDYHLTIDLYRIGIVSRKPGQHKEHFILKY
jgi:protein-L-isoaspartate O-methyltransferase